jgi:hypothetical protein
MKISQLTETNPIELARAVLTADDVKHIISRLPKKLRWTLHNVVSHPISEILSLIGAPVWICEWVHDVTIPGDAQ